MCHLNDMKINNVTLVDKNYNTNNTNVVTSFLQVKHIHDKIAEVENNINYNKYAQDIIKNVTSLPTKDDIDELLRAIARLQSTYHLSIESVLGDRNVISKFSYSDCYNIGVYLFNYNDFDKSIEWFSESLKKYEKTNEFDDLVTKEKILEYIAWTAYRKGDYLLAIKYSKILLNFNSTHGNMEENINWYRLYLEEGKPDSDLDENTAIYIKRKELYNRGCRGELRKPDEEIRQLHCKYLTENNSFLKLARVKYEELNKNPLVILFHNVISDREIKRLKELARGNLTRAKVWNVASGTEQKSEIRTSEFAWLDLDEDKVVPIITRRIQDLTNFSSRSYEKLQIASYNIGGHYEMHHDFHYDPPNAEIKKYSGYEYGNRIGTLMFYLSDVERGGATVLPYMNITIWPQKGTAAFWYNLHANGEPDVRTMHAACPVIKGNKWVANQWIHEREQEFRRPCKLKDDSKIGNFSW